MAERVEEHAPAAVKEPEPAVTPPLALPAMPAAGSLSPEQLMSMQQGAGNAAVASYMANRRGNSTTFGSPVAQQNGGGADMAWPPPGLGRDGADDGPRRRGCGYRRAGCGRPRRRSPRGRQRRRAGNR